MATKEFVDFKVVKAAVTMVRILDHYGLTSQFKRSANGDTLTGSCPIHKGDNPTQFRVSVSKNCWNCFGRCQRGGNILDFVSRMEDCTIRQAAIRISEWFGIDPRSEEEQTRKSEPTTPTKNELAEQISESKASNEDQNKPLGFELKKLNLEHPYFAERGLMQEALAHFGLGFCEHGSMTGRVVIPIRNVEGELVAYAGRWPGDPPPEISKYKLPGGFKKSQEIFNLHSAITETDEQPLIIVEGFFDCISLWQLGLTRTVALMGSSLSSAQEKLLRENTTLDTRIVLMLDEDEAGRAARIEIAARLMIGRFVKVAAFEEEGFQPEYLSADEISEFI